MLLEDGTVAVITGGAMGLGFSIAKELGKAGANLALLDINEEALNESVSKLTAEGYNTLGLVCDVSSGEEVQRTFDEVTQHFNKIDILVNNAAIAPETPFLECTEDQWDKIMAVNLKGYFNCPQAAAISSPFV